MTDDLNLHTWTLLWLVTALYLVWRHWQRGKGVGLLLGYIVSFGSIHWLATAMYVLPWYQHVDPTFVAEGMRQSALGIVALAIGVEGMTLFLKRSERLQAAPPPEGGVDPFAVNLYLAIGLLLQVVLFPLAQGLPSVTAIVVAGSTLTVVGIALKCWNAWQIGRLSGVMRWVLISSFLPFFTVATQGFLGYGMAAMMTVLAFVAAFNGRSWRGVVVGLLVAYLGMSVYVTYMRDRAGIRAVVWGGSDLSERVDSIVNTVGESEWFDIRDVQHLDRIDLRLNQNFLVGAAVRYIGGGSVDFARGATVSNAALSVIPRALWPEKPASAGSGDLVSIYTGIEFSKETSVGIGQVLEWYVNFGTAGVIGGFLLIGAILALIDRNALYWLEQGSVQRFAVWYLPGLSLLQIGGVFVEVVSTAAASLVVTAALHYATRRSGPARGPLGDHDLPPSPYLHDR